MGSLNPSSGRHCYILVVVDYTTQYPEAMPLSAAMPMAIVHELAILVSRVGFSTEIVTDERTVFMGKTVKPPKAFYR